MNSESNVLKRDTIEVRPDPMIYRSIKRAGYNWHQAILDILDNGVDAIRAESNKTTTAEDYSGTINFSVKRKNGKLDSIIIADNGTGIEPNMLPKCFTLGKSIKVNGDNLGVYGVGLKSAGLSLARKITIVSRAEASANFCFAVLDHSQGIKNFNIEVGVFSSDRDQEFTDMIGDQTGTIIVLSNLIEKSSLPTKYSSIYQTLGNLVTRIYRYNLSENSEFYVPVQFKFGKNRTVDKNSVYDCLTQEGFGSTTWIFGGPNGKFDNLPDEKYSAIKIRLSHTINFDEKVLKKKNIERTIAQGVEGSYKQAAYIIRNGREICLSRNELWKGNPRLSNFLLELMIDDNGVDENSLVKTDFAKKGVTFDDELQQYMQSLIAPSVLSREKMTQKLTSENQQEAKRQLENFCEENLSVLDLPEPRQTSRSPRNKTPDDIATSIITEVGSDVDNTTTFKVKSKQGATHKWKFEFENIEAAKDSPYWRDVDEETHIFKAVINLANPWVSSLISDNRHVELFSSAASMLISTKDMEDGGLEFIKTYGAVKNFFVENFKPQVRIVATEEENKLDIQQAV